MDAQILSVEINEDFLLVLFLVCSLLSYLGERWALRRYKRKWDKQKVQAFSEIITLIHSELDASSHNVKLIQEIYKIALSEVKNEPWFALDIADKLLQDRSFKLFRKKEKKDNEF